jgi:hypothetical protein
MSKWVVDMEKRQSVMISFEVDSNSYMGAVDLAREMAKDHAWPEEPDCTMYVVMECTEEPEDD